MMGRQGREKGLREHRQIFSIGLFLLEYRGIQRNYRGLGVKLNKGIVMLGMAVWIPVGKSRRGADT